MSSAISPYVPQSLEQAEKLANQLAMSALLPESLRNRPGDVLVTIITGHELGLSPMQAIRGLHVIKGKAVMSADLQVALVKKHPECIYFRLVESTDTIASYETERKGEGKTKMSFTIEQARNAQLAGDNWRKYPAAMLRARAASALARAVYPDLTLGVYDEDEAREIAANVDPAPPAEREINPPPVLELKPAEAKPAEAVVTGSRTAKLKAQLSARKMVIIDESSDATPEPQAAAPDFGEPAAPLSELTLEQIQARLVFLQGKTGKVNENKRGALLAEQDRRLAEMAGVGEPPADVSHF